MTLFFLIGTFSSFLLNGGHFAAHLHICSGRGAGELTYGLAILFGEPRHSIPVF
jgi:hypothetical protein